MNKQKAFVISGGNDTKLKELNELLDKGWIVKQSTPMSLGGESKSSYIFILAENVSE